MLSLQINTIVNALQNIPPGILWAIQLCFVYSSILIMMRLFGRTGIFILIGIFLITANIQVNKLTMLPGWSDPIPLGNVLIAGTYLCSDTLAEYYSASCARQGIWLGFCAFIIMIITMLFTLGFHNLSAGIAAKEGINNPNVMQHALSIVFSTGPALLIASLSSFVICQFFDIAIFIKIKKLTGGKYLWLRNNTSTLGAAFLDNCIFNILAWRVFAPQPIPWHILISSYIIGTYFIRVAVSVLDTPFIYLAQFFTPKNKEPPLTHLS